MLKRTEANFKLFLLACLVLAISFFHFGTPRNFMLLHLLLQTLFFVPVVLAGIWFGRKGGLVSAGAVTALYIHHAVTVMMPTSEMAASNGIQLALLFVAGFLSGLHAESKASSGRSIQLPSDEKLLPYEKLLLYIDGTPASLNAARRVATIVPPGAGTKVTLLGVFNTAQAGNLLPDTSSCHMHENQLESLKRATEEANGLLIEKGFRSGSISIRFTNSPDGRISDVILNEQQSGNYTAIVIGRTISDYGNSATSAVAASVARRASCAVWII